MNVMRVLSFSVGVFCLVNTGLAWAAEPQINFQPLAAEYSKSIQPLVKKFCAECHSTEDKAGELDLEQFSDLKHVRQHPPAWQKVAEMLDNGEMPPKDAEQLSPDERKQLRDWVQRYLDAEARASAGDPGPVVLRRLSNAEYTYTIRDLTGAPLDPAKEFPADSAAGEGFTNTGNALVMSPALFQKYLDAGKDIARHAVLLPDGFRFSPSANRGDWTEEALAKIRGTYARYADSSGASQVNLQGIIFDTNSGGRLPIEKYLAATLEERDALASRKKTIAQVAQERGLSERYLDLLWTRMTHPGVAPSAVIDSLRTRWTDAKPEDAQAIAADITRWQQTLFKFSPVGQIGKVGGPKAWMETVSPLVARQELRLKLPAPADGKDVTIYLAASDAGDGNANDFIVWERPRLVAPGRPDLLLRDVRAVTRELNTHRNRLFASAAKALGAASEAGAMAGTVDVAQLAEKYGIDKDTLAAWLDYLGIGSGEAAHIGTLMSRTQSKAGDYDFIQGWVGDDALSVVANSSDQHVRIPGNMAPHSIAVHPTPTSQVGIGWRSPSAATLHIEGTIQHAHPECGNGVVWNLELRRGNTRQKLAAGIAHGPAVNAIGPIDSISTQPGDAVALVIGPRDGNHACDLTQVNLTLKDGSREWNLAQDVSPNILAGNPHADRQGNTEVWSFFSEPAGGGTGHVIAAGSLLAKWQSAVDAKEKLRLADEVQQLLRDGADNLPQDSPDRQLFRQLNSLDGPLFNAARRALAEASSVKADDSGQDQAGLDPAAFGRHPVDGSEVEPASLCVQAPAVVEVRLPAVLVQDAEFVASGVLHTPSGGDGSAQLQVLTEKPAAVSSLEPSATKESEQKGSWIDNHRVVTHLAPIIVSEGSAARQRFEAAFNDFRSMFPAALCYPKIVPVDEVITLTLFHREDEPLSRLMLTDAERADLDRNWSDLRFISQDALTMVDAFTQLLEYASQDADPSAFEPMRGPINERAAAFRAAMVASESVQVDALLKFAARAYRRTLTDAESAELRSLYQNLRAEELPHEDAFQFTMARLFVSPAFLYRLENAPSGSQAAPVTDNELATRLSYFLWSSIPDEGLSKAAATGRLHEPDVLVAETRRMMKDARVRRLATEFACQWLHIYDFNALDEKSERHFPTFNELKGDMYEESIRFFTDLFQNDGSVLNILDADYLFVNDKLAAHYGVPNVTGAEWRRVDGAKQLGRGGILGLSATLAKQSGASRTSPILRGNWISEVLLGERLPRPPKDVPLLPEDEASQTLTMRELVEKHTSDERCAHCHVRIDPFGFSLEHYDAIGRKRDADLGGQAINTRTKVLDGTELDGLEGLRNYLVNTRRDTFLRQFCRKLLGYSLGRGVQLSDEPLLEEMQSQLKKNDYRFSAAVETIVRSPQFREIRGRENQIAEAH
jgi:hypothetical protein